MQLIPHILQRNRILQPARRPPPTLPRCRKPEPLRPPLLHLLPPRALLPEQDPIHQPSHRIRCPSLFSPFLCGLAADFGRGVAPGTVDDEEQRPGGYGGCEREQELGC